MAALFLLDFCQAQPIVRIQNRLCNNDVGIASVLSPVKCLTRTACRSSCACHHFLVRDHLQTYYATLLRKYVVDLGHSLSTALSKWLEDPDLIGADVLEFGYNRS